MFFGNLMCMVNSTHDKEVAEHANRVIVLKDGSIAEDRPVVEPRDAEKEKNQVVEEDTIP